jgi:hypothetical protein
MRWIGALAFASAMMGAVPALHAAQGGGPFLGAWTITEAKPAPWLGANPPAAPANTALINAKVLISRGGIEAPAPVGCSRAELWFEATNAKDLFSGMLTDEKQANDLGFSGKPMVLSVSCKGEGGALDFALADQSTAMFTLDNYIYVMKRGGN